MPKLNLHLKEKLESLAEKTTDLADTGYKLALIQVSEKASNAASSTILLLIILFLANCLLLFIGFGLAYWIGQSLNDLKLGFFIVSGIYLLMVIILLLLRKSVIIPYFRNIIIKKLYE
jgi:hypothetical protein